MLYFENTNGLPTSKSGCHSKKINRLRHLYSKLNAEFTSQVETQINPPLLTNKDSFHAKMFKNQPATSTLSDNKNELSSKR